ncbi:hypothetical protein GCM10022140_47480 [Rhodococcus aetherivorans]
MTTLEWQFKRSGTTALIRPVWSLVERVVFDVDRPERDMKIATRAVRLTCYRGAGSGRNTTGVTPAR